MHYCGCIPNSARMAAMQIAPLYTIVEKVIELKKGIVVMESSTGFPLNETNLYMLSPNGDVLWKAEKPNSNTLFTKMKLNEDFSISTFTNNGQFCEIDMETGKIISSSNFS
jgi:outer membrane protein assembly factor BamB